MARRFVALARLVTVARFSSVVRLGLAMLVLMLGAGIGLGAPQPAAAADPSLQVRITGTTLVETFDGGTWTIRVTNPHAFDVVSVRVDIYDYNLPIDYISISESGPLSCSLVQPVGAISPTQATCAGVRLAAGQTSTITLVGSTSWLTNSGGANLVARAYTNYPLNTTSDGVDYHFVSWRP
jgi:hypothetical protein